MPQLDPDTPWQVTALLVLAAIALAQIPTWIKVARTEKTVTKTADEVGVVRHEVKNSHETNLRHDIDDLKAAIKRLTETSARSIADVEGYAKDLDRSLRSVTHSLDRNVEMIDRRLTESDSAMQREISAAFMDHITTHHTTEDT